jgi:hypothetical protein
MKATQSRKTQNRSKAATSQRELRSPKADAQSKAFIDKARELGCDEDPKAFERAFSKVVPPRKPALNEALPPKPEKKKPRRGARG